MDSETDINLINPNVSFVPINLHFDHIKDIKPYERLSWFKIIKHFYQSNYGNTLKLESKSEIELLNNYYDVLTNNVDFPLESVVEYYYILNNLKERLPSDKSLDHYFMYENKSLNMEMIFWLYQKFMLSYKQIQKPDLDDKAKYSLTKECNSILQFILKNHENLVQKKLKHLPNFYKEETLAFWIKIINALQQELFIKITINNTKVTNYSLLSKMAYQVYVFYNDKVDVQNFLANRHNNCYETASDDESFHHDDFTELSSMIKVKKSVWIITTCYYYCMHLYTKMKKYGDPLTLLKCFLNNYPFNENHEDVANLKKQLITLHEIISKDNDFIYHEDIDTNTKDYMSIIESKVVPLNSNKYVLISEMLKKLGENVSLNEGINKMFKNIISMKTLELESIYTAEKERFWHEQTEEILTSNLQLESFMDYNHLNEIGGGSGGYGDSTSLSDDDLQKMSKTINSSEYSDIKAVKAKVVYLNEKAIELTKNGTTPNQVALKDSLNNAISNDTQLFQSINKYKHEIELMRNYQNLKITHDHVKLNADMNSNVATMNLLDIEDPKQSVERKIQENVDVLKEIKVQRTSILKKFKHNDSDSGSTIPNEDSSVLKIIAKHQDKEKLRQEFIEFINECYSFETSTLIGLNKQQQLLVNQTNLLLHDLQSKTNQQVSSTGNELAEFEKKLKDAYEAFKEFESNCRECLSYYNSLYELIPQHF